MSMPSDPYLETVRSTEVVVEPVVEPMVEPVVAPAQVVVDPAAQVFVEPAARVVEVQPEVRYVAVPTAPAVHHSVTTATGQQFAFDSVIVGIVGLVFTLIGLIAITRGGFDGPMNLPVVSVLGFTHTTSLGLIEAAIGICLVICAASRSRAGAVFFGLVLGVGGIVGAVQAKSFKRTLALESGLAWLAVIAALIVVLVSLLMPRMVRTMARTETI